MPIADPPGQLEEIHESNNYKISDSSYELIRHRFPRRELSKNDL